MIYKFKSVENSSKKTDEHAVRKAVYSGVLYKDVKSSTTGKFERSGSQSIDL